MSLYLNRPLTEQEEVVKTADFGGVTHLYWNGSEIDICDFLDAALYVLTNTDLKHKDPRLAFLKQVRELRRIPGYNADNNPKAKRLGLPSKETE